MIEKLYKEYGGRIEFIGVNMGIKKDLLKFLKEYGVSFPTVYDEGKKISSIFDADILTSVLIDKQGVIVYKERGLPDDMEEQLKKLTQ